MKIKLDLIENYVFWVDLIKKNVYWTTQEWFPVTRLSRFTVNSKYQTEHDIIRWIVQNSQTGQEFIKKSLGYSWQTWIALWPWVFHPITSFSDWYLVVKIVNQSADICSDTWNNTKIQKIDLLHLSLLFHMTQRKLFFFFGLQQRGRFILSTRPNCKISINLCLPKTTKCISNHNEILVISIIYMLDGSRFRCSLQEHFETVEGVERQIETDRVTSI